jgi:ketosteroid isomerase-like protein
MRVTATVPILPRAAVTALMRPTPKQAPRGSPGTVVRLGPPPESASHAREVAGSIPAAHVGLLPDRRRTESSSNLASTDCSRDTAGAMSQENVEVVRTSFAAWSSGNMDAVGALLVPDVIMRMPEGWPEPGPFVGRGAVMRQGEQMRQTWDADAADRISDFIDIADHVVVRMVWRTAGRGPESNMEFTIVYTVRNGRIYGMEYFWDHAEALEAVGLSE